MNEYDIKDTIAALSTPYSKSALAIIRMSGSKALEIASPITVIKSRYRFLPKLFRTVSDILNDKSDSSDIFCFSADALLLIFL